MQGFTFQNSNRVDHSSPFFLINRAGVNEYVEPEFDIKRTGAYPYCVIHYVTRGRGWVTCKGREYPLAKGQLFILEAFEPHRYKTDGKDRMGLDWIEFTGGDSLKLVQQVIARHGPIVGMPASDAVRKYLHRIFTLLQRDAENYRILNSKLLYSLLLSLLQPGLSSPAANSWEREDGVIGKVLSYIDTHLEEDLTIELLAGICGFNPFYFARLFHKVVGTTPSRYVMGKRVGKAKQLLAEAHLKVESVSNMLGFCNASHFIRVFKKAEGQTPSEYRRQSLLFRHNGS